MLNLVIVHPLSSVASAAGGPGGWLVWLLGCCLVWFLLCCCVVLVVLPAAGPFGLALVTNLIPQGSQIQAARHTGYLYAANNRCDDWGFALRRMGSGERDTRDAGAGDG